MRAFVAVLGVVALCLAAGDMPAAHAARQRAGVLLPSPHPGQHTALARSRLLMQPDEVVDFQVIGDWGRQGFYNQTEVADVMAGVARDVPPAFVLSVGDNFYPSGLTRDDDPNFAQSFTDVYSQPELQVPWYAVLGNHDYGDGIAPGDPPPACRRGEAPWHCSAGPLTQLGAEVQRRDDRWRCSRSRVLSLAGGALDIFMYDTTPFVQYYYDTEWASNPGARRAQQAFKFAHVRPVVVKLYYEANWAAKPGGIVQQSWEAGLAELEAALAASVASWKLVVGHHPVRSNGAEHGDTPELRRWVEPLLAKYGVQAYLAGHDHNLEHIKAAGDATHHIVSGAGSKTRPMDGGPDSLFQHGSQGFVTVSVRQNELRAAFFGLEGPQPMHVATISREPAAADAVVAEAAVDAAAAAADKDSAVDATEAAAALVNAPAEEEEGEENDAVAQLMQQGDEGEAAAWGADESAGEGTLFF